MLVYHGFPKKYEAEQLSFNTGNYPKFFLVLGDARWNIESYFRNIRRQEDYLRWMRRVDGLIST